MHRNLGTNPIANIVEMLELKGIKVILLEYVDEIDGFATFTSTGVPVLLVNTNNRTIERIRFTIIHELAHLLLFFAAHISATNKKLKEEFCHYFSSCFLMPRDMLIKMIGGPNRSYINISELINIKEYFGISLRAIVHRLRKVEVITDIYYQKWMVYMSKTYGAKSEPGNYHGVEKSNLLDQLVSRALSEGIISTSKAAALCNISIGDFNTKKIFRCQLKGNHSTGYMHPFRSRRGSGAFERFFQLDIEVFTTPQVIAEITNDPTVGKR